VWRWAICDPRPPSCAPKAVDKRNGHAIARLEVQVDLARHPASPVDFQKPAFVHGQFAAPSFLERRMRSGERLGKRRVCKRHRGDSASGGKRDAVLQRERFFSTHDPAKLFAAGKARDARKLVKRAIQGVST
jgi:hypothetical protein